MNDRAPRFGLSKSKIAMFEQCPKRLWLSVHRPEQAHQDERAEVRFATGHEVGAVACRLLATGTMVEANPDLAAALATTRALLNEGREQPILEGTFEHDGVLVRIDILEPSGGGYWRMAEVKSSTGPKDYHLGDLATQLWVTENAGVPIATAIIRHIDSSFVLEREGDYSGLFADSDLMADVAPIVANRANVVEAARNALAGEEPGITPGDQCSAPFPCEFANYCHAHSTSTPEWPVTVLPRGGGKKFLAQGIDDLLSVDPSALSETQRRVYDATVTDVAYHDAQGARQATTNWAYPRTWLDFETIGFAIPRWVGTRPYQQVPFQFSALVEDVDGGIDHHEFLSLDGADPRRSCAEALATMVPPIGAVIGYNASFEKGRILELAEVYPDLANRLCGIANRVVDLLPVVRAHWYHRDQRGSWSIKAVLPTIAPQLDYAALEVKDGGQAQEAYLEAIAGETSEGRRSEIDVALRAYCKRDTDAMIVLARHLVGVIE